MNKQLPFPLFSKGSNKTRDIIVTILSSKHPLKASEILKIGKEKFNHIVGRSTIHESLKELEKSMVIERGDEGYSLDRRWVEGISSFVGSLQQEYLGYSSMSQVMEFPSLEELDIFYKKFKRDFISNCKGDGKDQIIWMANHIRWKVIGLDKNLELTQNAVEKRIKYNLLIRGNSPLDKKSELIYKKVGAKIKIGAKIIEGHNIGIFNDTMLIYHYNPEVRQAIEEMYKTAKGIEDINFSKYFDLYYKKRKHYILIVKDKKFVDFYKKYISSFF